MITSKEAYARMREYAGTEQMLGFRTLIDVLIHEIRERQDNAEGHELYRNQGAIKELKNMLRNFKPKGEPYIFTDSYQN